MTPDEGFEGFYTFSFPRVFRGVYALTRDRDIAEEATQEAFARALVRWPSLRSQSWAAGWVMSTALNHARRMKRRRNPPPAEQATYEMMDVAGNVDLWSTIRSLPFRQQQAVVLHYLEDLPIHAVARLMRCREGTVKAHLGRARKTLVSRTTAVEI